MSSCIKQGWKLAGLAILLVLAGRQTTFADDGCCSDCCNGGCPIFHCPHYKHCAEGPPRICITQGCPKPSVSPCNQPNWGYFETCWSPWPWPTDYSHCAVQPLAAMIYPPSAPPMDLPPMMRSPSSRPAMPLPPVAPPPRPTGSWSDYPPRPMGPSYGY